MNSTSISIVNPHASLSPRLVASEAATSDSQNSSNGPNKTFTLCLFGCLTSLGFRNKIVRQLAFFPPKVPGYEVAVKSHCLPPLRRQNSSPEFKQDKRDVEQCYEDPLLGARACTDTVLARPCRNCGSAVPVGNVLEGTRIFSSSNDGPNRKISAESLTTADTMRDSSLDNSSLADVHSVVSAHNSPETAFDHGALCSACATHVAEEFGESQYQFLLPYAKLSDGEGSTPCDVESMLGAGPVRAAFQWLKTSRGEKIGALLLKQKKASFSDVPFVIFSHGNSTDLGYMFPHYFALACKSRCHVLGYEYTGYGRSSGVPSEKDTFADVRAAYKYSRETLGVPWKNIIIYGHSLGSGPSCDLASDKRCPVGGMILHSPIASGLRMLLEDLKKSPRFDCYKNADKIQRVQCPIFLIHGTKDSQVSCSHSRLLYALACASRLQRATSAQRAATAFKQRFLKRLRRRQSRKSYQRNSRRSRVVDCVQPKKKRSNAVSELWTTSGDILSSSCVDDGQTRERTLQSISTTVATDSFSDVDCEDQSLWKVGGPGPSVCSLSKRFPLMSSAGRKSSAARVFDGSRCLLKSCDCRKSAFAEQFELSGRKRTVSVSLAECKLAWKSALEDSAVDELVQEGDVVLWLAGGADHDDIEHVRRSEFYNRVNSFLQGCLSAAGQL